MSETSIDSSENKSRIVVEEDGPYHVYGNVPLVQKTQVVSEFGEPLTWKKEKEFAAKEKYALCRCGQSKNKPYCDSTHYEIDFDGTETADTGTTAERLSVDDSGEGIVVKMDGYLCMLSGFCANRQTSIDRMVKDTSEPRVRAEIIAMIDRCPSGAYSYSINKEGENIEADLPVQIAATTEITEDGAIQGPLWVTGNIPVIRADGEPFETRNRVTLCCCGQSYHKPLCDGTHRGVEQNKLRQEKSENH